MRVCSANYRFQCRRQTRCIGGRNRGNYSVMMPVSTADANTTAANFQLSFFRTDKRQSDRPIRDNEERQRKLSGACFHCNKNKKGQKALNCRTRKRELPQNDPPSTESNDTRTQRTQAKPRQDEPSCNPKLVCQICGNTGHSAATCTHRNTKMSAYRGIPYQSQKPDENRGFRKNFKKAHKRQFQVRQFDEAQSNTSQSWDEIFSTNNLISCVSWSLRKMHILLDLSTSVLLARILPENAILQNS